jgi:hypothetical protein
VDEMEEVMAVNLVIRSGLGSARQLNLPTAPQVGSPTHNAIGAVHN